MSENILHLQLCKQSAFVIHFSYDGGFLAQLDKTGNTMKDDLRTIWLWDKVVCTVLKGSCFLLLSLSKKVYPSIAGIMTSSSMSEILPLFCFNISGAT